MNNDINNDMQALMDEIDKSMVQLRRGEIVTGKIISVNDKEIIVNVGYKSDGIIPKEEISNDMTINPREIANIGDEIKVCVLNLDDGEGNLLLSKKRVVSEKGWDDLEKIQETESLVETKVVEAVRGGVIAIARGVRCFIPASQLSDRFVDDLKPFEGSKFNTKVIEIDKSKNKAILSRKVVLEEENKGKREELFSRLENGQRVKGEVKRITDFGAFIDIGGIDGLAHISELSWGRIKHPSQVVSVGDIIEVEVLNFDKEKNKVSLGLKQIQVEPWSKIGVDYSIGNIVKGKVVRLVDFGAFVELEPGLDGLVHISEISDEHINKPSDKLAIDDEIEVKILDIKLEEKRISLSIKAVKAAIEEEVSTDYMGNDDSVTIGDVFEINDKNKES